MLRVREQVACPNLSAEKTNIQSSGRPITIAFLDTGICEHPDFRDRIIKFQDFVYGEKKIYDDCGHGTHVCGIAAGDGRLSGGKYRGIAPESKIVMCKVLDEMGDGFADKMLEGLTWVIENRVKYDIRILNISIGLGTLQDEKKKEQLQKKVEEAWACGLVVVCAAGNMGPKSGTLSPLGASSKVIAVGCHDGTIFGDKEHRCELYSGRGPTKYEIKKPDIVAPGTDIISCNARFQQTKDNIFAPYITKSGTSMATPLVSGAVALLLQNNPTLSNDMVKKKLLYAATDLQESWNKQGWGMLNIQRALDE